MAIRPKRWRAVSQRISESADRRISETDTLSLWERVGVRARGAIGS